MSTPFPSGAIQVRQLDASTYALRERLDLTREAPFMYLLVGQRRALLIDTGDVADPAAAPLAQTVMALLPSGPEGRRPLLVAHSHGHLDHRMGDAQLAGLPGVQVVGPKLEEVRGQFGFGQWPEGVAQIDLGGRVVDVLPAPGHHPTELVFYDRATGFLFTGDFLLPGRILVDDLAAYRASARRVAAFAQIHPVSAVLGGHIEKDRGGGLYPWQAPLHPDEAPLELGKADVLALPGALDRFNGFYTQTGALVVENPIHNLTAGAVAAALILAVILYGAFRAVRRWRRRRRAERPEDGLRGHIH